MNVYIRHTQNVIRLKFRAIQKSGKPSIQCVYFILCAILFSY